eukprot:TRINITY_DN36593_c0_g1_i1.p1 TRINITY_DN36593_c0_g1~~TRINITY_DN36593_c0_g1_i1.p1  ORF type:complete len:467 (-),score=70.37 TRINITY_DN36593_c0_g1_i1:512-1912(-)
MIAEADDGHSEQHAFWTWASQHGAKLQNVVCDEWTPPAANSSAHEPVTSEPASKRRRHSAGSLATGVEHGLLAGEKGVPANTCILAVPVTLLLHADSEGADVLLVPEDLPGEHPLQAFLALGKSDAAGQRKRVASIARLALERHRGAKSRWAAYIASLPRSTQAALHVEGADQLYKGTPLEKRLLCEKAALNGLVAGLLALARGQGGEWPHVLAADFRWAHEMFFSRAVCLPTKPGARDRQLTECFAPVIDIANHKPGSLLHAVLSDTTDSVELRCGRAHKPGEVIWNNYGTKSNEDLVLHYGFVVVDNVCDTAEFKIPSADGEAVKLGRRAGLPTLAPPLQLLEAARLAAGGPLEGHGEAVDTVYALPKEIDWFCSDAYNEQTDEDVELGDLGNIRTTDIERKALGKIVAWMAQWLETVELSCDPPQGESSRQPHSQLARAYRKQTAALLRENLDCTKKLLERIL